MKGDLGRFIRLRGALDAGAHRVTSYRAPVLRLCRVCKAACESVWCLRAFSETMRETDGKSRTGTKMVHPSHCDESCRF